MVCVVSMGNYVQHLYFEFYDYMENKIKIIIFLIAKQLGYTLT